MSSPALFKHAACGLVVLPLAVALQACHYERLPDCVIKTPAPQVKPAPGNAKQLMVGIDGSGSMLGYAQAADSTLWRSLLQSLNLSAKTTGLTTEAFRIGGGKAQPLSGLSITQATDPCFFSGCGSYPAVASSLETLWDLQVAGGSPPVRLLVTDLEVNQSDITNLVGGIRKDLARGVAAGVLALKLPFQGQIFNSFGKSIFTGKLNRPIYLLATGQADQVRSFLEDMRRNMALKGVRTEEVTILDASVAAPTLTVVSVMAIPPNQGGTGINISLDGISYGASNNQDYGFVALNPGANGIELSTVQSWSGGSTRPDLGLVKLERIPLGPNGRKSLDGIRLKSMSVAGSNLRLELEIPNTVPDGALRATVPRGNLPEQWWIDWDRSDPSATNAKEQTDGLLSLMTKVSEEVYSTSSTPAAALCVVFKHTT